MKNLNPTEAQDQIALIKWAWVTKQKTLVHSVNEGKRSIGQLIFAKKMGMRAGFPDLALYEPRNGKHGLFIEMKRKTKGVLTDEQKWWLNHLNDMGYHAVCCYGLDQAIAEVEKYLAK